MNKFLECCCVSVEQVEYAQEHGGRRIELCEDLQVGGVTPSAQLLADVMAVARIPVNVLVRPRGGDFVFSEEEVDEMMDSISLCADCGVHGVVIGALDKDGNVDMPVMEKLVSQARSLGLSVTFHRAFDVCADPRETFERVVELGCDTLLTSGHEADAYLGRELIAELKARKQTIIMAGCGVRPSNIDLIDADEYHASFSYFK